MTAERRTRDEQPSRETRMRIASEAERAIADLSDRVRRDWALPQDNRVQAACILSELAANFVLCYLKPSGAPGGIPSVRHDEDFASSLEALGPVVEAVDSCLRAIGEPGHEAVLIDKLSSLTRDMLSALEGAVATLIAVARDDDSNKHSAEDRRQALQEVNEVRGALHARRLIDEAEGVLDEAREVRDETKKVIGEIGADSLGIFYNAYADRETRSADRLRWVAGGLLCAIAAGAFLLNISHEGISPSTELLRLSASVPIAVLAGYAARESTKHRRSAKWARELAIALHTLPAYVEPENSIRTELWRALGLRAFISDEKAGASIDSGLYDDFLTTFDKAQEIVRRVKGEPAEPAEPPARPTGQQSKEMPR